jgi:hypothetical protein
MGYKTHSTIVSTASLLKVAATPCDLVRAAANRRVHKRYSTPANATELIMNHTVVPKSLRLEPAARPVRIMTTSRPMRLAINPTLRPGLASASRARSSRSSGVVMSQSMYLK